MIAPDKQSARGLASYRIGAIDKRVGNEMDPPILCQDWVCNINLLRHPNEGSIYEQD
jgi:hypothetical protein